MLTHSQCERYSRHLILPEVGEEGQRKLLSSRVLIVGAGGLGSPAALYLGAAGVGTIGLIDNDNVDLSNLQRQVIHTTASVGTPKVDSAAQAVADLNPDVNIIRHRELLTPDNAPHIIAGYDFIVDATDSPMAKFLINDTCVALGKPFSHGGIRQYEGNTFTYLPGHACLRCLFNIDTPVDELSKGKPFGLLGAIVGIIGTIQATETLKYLTGVGELLSDRVLRVNALTMQFHTTSFRRRQHCICTE